MDPFPFAKLVSIAWRRRNVPQLLEDLQAWEQEGRDLLARIAELTDPGDDTHEEVLRVLRALER